jgi:hypothetical protein
MADAINGNRRNLLKAIVCLPFVRLPFRGKEVTSVELPGQLIIFFDPSTIDASDVMQIRADDAPGLVGSLWIPVRVPQGKTVEDCIRLYHTPADGRTDALDLSKWGARELGPPTMDKNPL